LTLPNRLTRADAGTIPRAAARLAETGGRLLGALSGVRPLYVLGALVVAQWIAVVALARTVARNGWIFYQGGDQLWYYTTAWLLAHGQMPLSVVGYGWSTLLIPIAAIAGPNVADGLPAIAIFDIGILLPAALLAVYGIGRQLGGRIFGYWTTALWIAMPFVGIVLTDAGYHQRYTELTLPQALGLTGMADFPSMVMLALAAFFVLRASRGGALIDAALGGLLVGFGIGIKPSSSLCLAGMALCLAWSRRWRAGAVFAAGLAPSLLMLTLWKWRGYGFLPILQHSAVASRRLAAGVDITALPLSATGLHKYIDIDWHHLGLQFGALREHFWSGRLIQWVAIAGLIGLARLSRPAALLFGGWFFAFVLVKGTFPSASIDDGSLLRIMIPAIPAFLVLVASLPLLIPGVPQRLRAAPPQPWGAPRLHWSLVGAALAVFVIAPAALTATAHRLTEQSTVAYTVAGDMPVPVDAGWKLRSTVTGGRVLLTWHEFHPQGGRVFYRVFRDREPSAPLCRRESASSPIACAITGVNFNSTRQGAQYDTPGRGRWTYRVGLAANWRNDPSAGDVYLLSAPQTIRLP
jgi:hypothetical protein